MREIKYRQWGSNEWHYWGFIDGVWVKPIEGLGSYQFTGLKDKKGVEVYEAGKGHWNGGNLPKGLLIPFKVEYCKRISGFRGVYLCNSPYNDVHLNDWFILESSEIEMYEKNIN